MVDSRSVQVVRSFNRVVSERIGALEDRYLSEEQNLGEARLLYEIGESGSSVADLRRRLHLDSGYISRLLRSLESAGLIQVTADTRDGRRRQAVLTEQGWVLVTRFDQRSDQLVKDILNPLTERQRARLVTSMAEVDRLLTASMITMETVDPESADAVECMAHFAAELAERFPAGFDPADSAPVEPSLMRAPPHGCFLLARLRGVPVACGALKHDGSGIAEIKRMWVRPDHRGLGLGRRVLSALEDAAVNQKVHLLRLETHSVLSSAIDLYRSSGFTSVPRFGDDPYAEHWYAKELGASATATEPGTT